MGNILMPGGGGGADLDVVTAGAGDVLAEKVIVGADGESIIGTMSERGAWNARVTSDATKIAIPAGHHNGSGYVESWISNLNPGNILSGKNVGGVAGTATNDAVLDPSKLVTGYSGYDDGVLKYGTMPIQNAETDGDRAWATNISCSEGQANLGIRNGHYINGVNWIKGNIPNFNSWNIRKGVNMGGLIGTFQGMVDSPLFIIQGREIKNLQNKSFAQMGQLTFNEFRSHAINNEMFCRVGYKFEGAMFAESVNVDSYNYLKIHMRADDNYNNSITWIVGLITLNNANGVTNDVYDGSNIRQKASAYMEFATSSKDWKTIMLDVSHLAGNYHLFICTKNNLSANVYYACIDELYFHTV